MQYMPDMKNVQEFDAYMGYCAGNRASSCVVISVLV